MATLSWGEIVLNRVSLVNIRFDLLHRYHVPQATSFPLRYPITTSAKNSGHKDGWFPWKTRMMQKAPHKCKFCSIVLGPLQGRSHKGPFLLLSPSFLMHTHHPSPKEFNTALCGWLLLIGDFSRCTQSVGLGLVSLCALPVEVAVKRRIDKEFGLGNVLLCHPLNISKDTVLHPHFKQVKNNINEFKLVFLSNLPCHP